MEERNDLKNDEVLIQGDSYQEGGSDNSAKEKPEEKGILGNVKNKTFIAGGIVAVLLLITVIVVITSTGKENAPADFLLEDEPVFEYTAEETEALRLAGYTGYEIEAFAYEEQDAEYLIEKAAKERRKQYKEEILPYFNAASKEFKELWNNTWVGQEELTYNEDSSEYSYYTEVMNVDYEKLPARGHQLFIKFYLENGDACFTSVTPKRYQSLKESGNILLSIDYTMI